MNILVVHETEYIEKVVFEYQIIPELWSSSGHNVFVVDFPTNLDKKSFFDLGSMRTRIIKNVKKADKKKGITLIRPGYIKLPVLSRLTAFFSHYFAIKKAIIEHKIDVIYLLSVPTNGLQTVFLAKKYKIPVHFRLLDVLHQLVPNRILSYPTYLMEKVVYRNVTELSAVTPRLSTYAVKMGANKKTSFFLPTGSDSDLFCPKKKSKKLLEKFDLDNKSLVLLFAGTLYNFSGLYRIIEYLGQHQDDYSNMKILILGRGEQKVKLDKLIEKYSLQKMVIMAGFVGYEKLSDYINLADICINPVEVNKITNIIIPSKIYQYLSCRKPVIATRLLGLLEIFPDNSGRNNVFYFDLNNPKKFFDIALKIKPGHFADASPTLQDIAKTLAGYLEKLTKP